MKTFPQDLKRKLKPSKKRKKKKRETEITQVHYLDDFVDVTSHDLIRRHP